MPLNNGKKTSKGKINKRKHWRFLQTTWEYPIGLTGTAMLIQYAYFLDEKLGKVLKLEVKNIQSQ